MDDVKLRVYEIVWDGQIIDMVSRSDFDAQRLRADTAEGELAKANEKIDRAWNRSCALDHKACIPGALDAWKRPVPQHLPYDFSGNPGASATQYCNGWNDAGGYWSGHATEVEAKLAAAEQRIAQLKGALENLLDAYSKPDDRICCSGHQCGCMGATNHQQAEYYAKEALNPKPEAGSHEVAREALKMENQRITPARFKCLACGDCHEGSGNLPCPKMLPNSITLTVESYKKRED